MRLSTSRPRPRIATPLVVWAFFLFTVFTKRKICLAFPSLIFHRSPAGRFASTLCPQVSALCALTKCYAVLALDFCTPGYAELEEAWKCVCATSMSNSEYVITPGPGTSLRLSSCLQSSKAGEVGNRLSNEIEYENNQRVPS